MEKKIINRNNILQHLWEYEFWLAGKKLVDLLDTTNYKFDFTITWEQYYSFREYAIQLIKKVLRCNRTKAEMAFDKFYEEFGLRRTIQ
jgi:hypothetical protein